MRYGLHSTTLGSVSPDATQSVAVLKIVDVMLYQSRLAIVSNADERVYSLLVVCSKLYLARSKMAPPAAPRPWNPSNGLEGSCDATALD